MKNRLLPLVLGLFLTLPATSPANDWSKRRHWLSNRCAGLFFSFRTEMSKLDGKFYEDIERLRIALSTPPYLKKDLLGTTVYYSAHVNPHPTVPQIRNDSQGIVIALGGAGGAGDGRAFMRNASSLARFGIDLVSFDYPYHGEGPRDPKYKDAEIFMNQVLGLIRHFKSSGKPVALMGHSFGVTMIQEILKREPDTVIFGVAMSPGGNVTPGMLQHYIDFRHTKRWEQFLASYNFELNHEGEKWEEGEDAKGGVAAQFSTTRDTSTIPTDVEVAFIAGEKDPWSNPHLLKELVGRFPKSSLEIIPNGGHHSVFDVRVGKESLVTRRIVDLFEKHLGRKLPKGPSKIEAKTRVEFLYQESELFRRWFDHVGYTRPTQADPDIAFKTVLSEWTEFCETHYLKNMVVVPTALKSGLEQAVDTGRLPHAFATPKDFFIDGIPLNDVPTDRVKEVARFFLEIDAIKSKPRTKWSQAETAKMYRFVAGQHYSSRRNVLSGNVYHHLNNVPHAASSAEK